MAALGGADRPGGADVVGACVEGVVGALAEGGADGMDRREVDDVEAHRGDGGQPVGGGAQGAADGGAVRCGARAFGAREELVPRAVEGAAPLHDQRHRTRDGEQFAQRVAVQRFGDLGGQGGGQAGGGGELVVAQRVHGAEDRLPAVALGYVGGRPLVQLGALGEDQLGVDTRRDLDRGVLPPGGDRIGPGLDGVRPAALDIGGDLGPPAVGAGLRLAHRRPGAAPACRVAQHHIGGYGVMALAEDGGRDFEGLAHHRLRRAAAAIDLRADVQNRDATDHGLTWGL